MTKPTSSDILRCADQIAKKRYPEGCGATELANIVREAARELGLTISYEKVGK